MTRHVLLIVLAFALLSATAVTAQTRTLNGEFSLGAGQELHVGGGLAEGFFQAVGGGFG